MIPTIADVPFASARTFTQVVALADTRSVKPAVRVESDSTTAVLAGSGAVADAVGAGFAASRTRGSVGAPGRTFAGRAGCRANEATTATDARRGTDDCSVITSGGGDCVVLAGRSCHPLQPTAMVTTAAATFPVHCGTGARVTEGHQRQPSREAG
jgi:hypothetical protein